MMASIWPMMASYGSRCGQHRLRMLYDGTHMAFVCCMMAFLLSICVGCGFQLACDGYLCGVRVRGVSVPTSLRWLVAVVVLLVVVVVVVVVVVPFFLLCVVAAGVASVVVQVWESVRAGQRVVRGSTKRVVVGVEWWQ